MDETAVTPRAPRSGAIGPRRGRKAGSSMSSLRAAGRTVLYLALAAAIASCVAMVFKSNWDGALRFAVVSGLLIGTRFANVPTPFAAAFSALLLFATWAGVAHWYRQISLLDGIVHFFAPGSLAAVGYYVLVQAALLPDPRHPSGVRSWAPVLWVTLVGSSAAVVWEYYEWVVEQLAPVRVRAGYTDTVVDLFAGMLGSFVAGMLVLAWARHRARVARG